MHFWTQKKETKIPLNLSLLLSLSYIYLYPTPPLLPPRLPPLLSTSSAAAPPSLILLSLRNTHRDNPFEYLDDLIPNFQQDSMVLLSFNLASFTVLEAKIETHRNAL